MFPGCHPYLVRLVLGNLYLLTLVVLILSLLAYDGLTTNEIDYWYPVRLCPRSAAGGELRFVAYAPSRDLPFHCRSSTVKNTITLRFEEYSPLRGLPLHCRYVTVTIPSHSGSRSTRHCAACPARSSVSRPPARCVSTAVGERVNKWAGQKTGTSVGQ